MGRIVKLKDRQAQPTRLSEESREAAAVLIAAQSRANRILKRSKNEVIDLALHLARQIVGRAVETDPCFLDSIYSKALKAASDLGPAIVFVNPEDRAFSGIDQTARASGFEVIEDPAMGRAQCRVKSGDVEISAMLDDALKALETAMKGCESV